MNLLLELGALGRTRLHSCLYCTDEGVGWDGPGSIRCEVVSTNEVQERLWLRDLKNDRSNLFDF